MNFFLPDPSPVIPGREQRQLRASPESIFSTVVMDSGPAPPVGYADGLRVPE
ncbi:hypothetical protein V1282_000263 [Nitrobacteraceae bacterium AZCC 2146]